MKPLRRDNVYTDANSLEVRMEQVERRYIPPAGHYEIKLFADRGALDGNLPDSAVIVSAGDGKFMLLIPPSLNRASLTLAEAGVSAAGSDDIEIELINVGPDPSTPATTAMLVSPILIPAGDFISWTAGSSLGTTVIDTSNAQVASGDWISINVLAAGSFDTAEGLAMVLDFDF